MTDFDELNKQIEKSGMTMVSISNKTGITRATLYNRLNGIGEFTATEIVALTEALHLTKSERDHIFLGQS